MKLYEVIHLTHSGHPTLGDVYTKFFAVEFSNGTVVLDNSPILTFGTVEQFFHHYESVGWEVKEVESFVRVEVVEVEKAQQELNFPTPELSPEHLSCFQQPDEEKEEEKKPARKKRTTKKKEKTNE